MKLRALFALLVALAAIVPAAARAQDRAATVVSTTPIEAGTSYTIASAVLGDEREVNVWLPIGYAASADRYPVVYLLDGALDQDFTHIAGLGALASLSWTFGPVIIVGIQTRVRLAELTPPATDPRYLAAFPQSGGAARFRQFLEREVIPFVEQRLRTSERRALMGESLAGLFVVDTLLSQPALFSDYVAVSPSLWWDDRRAFRQLDPAHPPALSGARLYLAVADEGGIMQEGIDSLRAALAQLPPSSLELHYADCSATATHATVLHHAAEDALRWLYPAPPFDGETPWYMIEGASPPAAP